ncbi:hypothetical protein CTA1_5577 [Colletotrichum tanaceti]|uniref:Uncharacterized protein n=1 Tax=Colletotrichum tanaceti TaxID=1306861 RepID=A0A4U6X311_9PEZI|nr:hypothetical protein CTA1_5577 [Colletotrichum tanaceti]
MSGTAPNDAAPGDRAADDDGIQQAPPLSDANQHGQPQQVPPSFLPKRGREREREQDTNLAGGCRNTVDETKDTTTATTTTHDTPAAGDHQTGETGDADNADDTDDAGDGDGGKHHKGALSGLVDDIVNKALGFGGASEAAAAAERKAEADHPHQPSSGGHP